MQSEADLKGSQFVYFLGTLPALSSSALPTKVVERARILTKLQRLV